MGKRMAEIRQLEALAGSFGPAPCADFSPGGWSRRLSAACTVVGAACLWAWGYVVSLSTALFPDANVSASIGIELAYFVSQLTLCLLGLASAALLRRWHPSFPPAAAMIAAIILALASVVVSALMRLPKPPTALVAVCGVAYGVGGLVLSIAWGARFSLGSRSMRRLVLLSFLLGYAIYLGSLYLPHLCAQTLACALPLASGALWLLDSWRRHQLTSEVWPSGGDAPAPGEGRDAIPLQGDAAGSEGFRAVGDACDLRFLGEVSEGSTDVAILPWRSMALFAVTSLVGNLVSSLIMGATYDGAAVIFPGAFLVCACITVAALAVVGPGARRAPIERLYRYCLPFAALGMLLILVSSVLAPAGVGAAGTPGASLGSHALAGALVTGASIFLQALVMLKVTETVQETGISPMLAFGVGQGLIGGVVFVGNVGGRLLSELPGDEGTLLAIVCAVGVFVLFFLLVMVADGMADRLERASGESAPADAPHDDTAALAAFAARFGLTPREADVCAYLVHGRSLPFIAEHLYVTAGTVKTHAMHIYRKTGVGSKQELMDLYESSR